MHVLDVAEMHLSNFAIEPEVCANLLKHSMFVANALFGVALGRQMVVNVAVDQIPDDRCLAPFPLLLCWVPVLVDQATKRLRFQSGGLDRPGWERTNRDLPRAAVDSVE